MLNSVILMGRMVADPELKQTPSGVSVAVFRLAVERNYQDKESGQRQTDFINCVAWRQTGEFISRYFSKGSMIAIEGSIQTRQYQDKSGNKRTAVEVIVDQAYFAGDNGCTGNGNSTGGGNNRSTGNGQSRQSGRSGRSDQSRNRNARQETMYFDYPDADFPY